MYDFKFGGESLSKHFARVTSRPPVEVAEYDFTMQELDGKSGADFIDNKRYKNVEFEREVGFFNSPARNVYNYPQELIQWLAYKKGYQDFEDSDHPGMITQAVLVNFPQVQRELSRIYKAPIRFSRLPFWYLKSAYELSEVSKSAPTTFVNPYPIDSKPLILLHFDISGTSPASASFKITTGGVTTTYSVSSVDLSVSGYVYFDCETQEVRQGTASVNYLDFPAPKGFEVGESTFEIFSGSSALSDVWVAPRWRSL